MLQFAELHPIGILRRAFAAMIVGNFNFGRICILLDFYEIIERAQCSYSLLNKIYMYLFPTYEPIEFTSSYLILNTIILQSENKIICVATYTILAYECRLYLYIYVTYKSIFKRTVLCASRFTLKEIISCFFIYTCNCLNLPFNIEDLHMYLTSLLASARFTARPSLPLCLNRGVAILLSQ